MRPSMQIPHENLNSIFQVTSKPLYQRPLPNKQKRARVPSPSRPLPTAPSKDSNEVLSRVIRNLMAVNAAKLGSFESKTQQVSEGTRQVTPASSESSDSCSTDGRTAVSDKSSNAVSITDTVGSESQLMSGPSAQQPAERNQVDADSDDGPASYASTDNSSSYSESTGSSGSDESSKSGSNDDDMFMSVAAQPKPKPEDNAAREKKPNFNKILTKLAKTWGASVEIIKQSLGQGSFGMVKALKIFSQKTASELQGAAEYIKAALKLAAPKEIEAELAVLKELVGSPGIIQLINNPERFSDGSVVADDALVGYVMEMGVGSVASKSLESPFSLPQILLMAQDIVQGGVSMASKNWVHRDLKSDNLVVFKDQDGLLRCKFADFGLAVHEGEEVDFQGTLSYIAPEAVAGTYRASSKQDVFSAGLIIAEHLIKLSGQKGVVRIIPPVGGLVGDPSLYEKNYYDPAVTLLNAFKGKDPESGRLIDLVIRMMDQAPEKRPTFYECYEQLSVLSKLPFDNKDTMPAPGVSPQTVLTSSGSEAEAEG